METNKISRQELNDLVWKESLASISKRLNIPFNHLRKICSKMNIPVPPNGYWSKIRFVKGINITELPKDYTGEDEIKLFPETEDIRNTEVLTFYKKSAVDPIKEDKKLYLTVSDKLTDPDELVTLKYAIILLSDFQKTQSFSIAEPSNAYSKEFADKLNSIKVSIEAIINKYQSD
jgi:hypothetical protein